MIINLNITGKEKWEQLQDMGQAAAQDFVDEVFSESKATVVGGMLTVISVMSTSLLTYVLLQRVMMESKENNTTPHEEVNKWAKQMCEEISSGANFHIHKLMGSGDEKQLT